MKKFIAALFIGLFFVSFINAQDESRASITWQVQKYDITATLPQAETERNLTVKAVLNLKNVSSGVASRLTLRISPNAEVSAFKVNDAATDFSKAEEKIDGSRTLQRIVVRVPSIQPNATFTVAVDYKLNVKENSGLNALSSVGSQFLPLAFWYPTPNSWYFARGADFAPMRLQVNSANGETVIASGTQNNNAFEQKLNGQPFFVSGNWDTVNANGVSVFIQKGANADEQKRANELALLASEAKTFTANFLGTAPDVPIRIVAVRRGAGFSSGGTIFVDESAVRRQKIDSQTAMTIAEAVAKIWIGNAVSVNGDSFGVIREGLTRYVATQFLEKQFGKDIADIERLRQRTAYAAVVKRDSPLSIVSPIDDYYYPTVANKGAMIWRLLAKKVGQDEFFNIVRSQMNDGNLNLSEMRSVFSMQKEILDYSFDQVTETNLLIGVPHLNGAETKIALRNLGAIDATVNIVATTANGETLTAQSTIPAKKFGEINFKTTNKIVRAEIDTDKFYPQTDYFDDVAPSEFKENDVILVVKRAFDQQDFMKAEKNARLVLQASPRFDDIRTWLARALYAQGKTADAEKEFRAVLEEKLPTARSLAWANVGLGEIALKSNQNAQATKFFEEAIKANAEYGASLAARSGINKSDSTVSVDETIKSFFAQFDKAALSGRKADVNSLVVSGEMARFSDGISGQAQEWNTRVVRVNKLDANTALAEVNLKIKLLNKAAESGTAVFLLSKVGGSWKLSGVEIFEVR
ncbi:MAG: tetratricopeptide repeat protein [Acidobacteria bacterium]|jgi:tetratricopeptide (TPR) repeat protein|nr:tetratricopeptide repeat protein [Acidobacteriota bacterium]